MLESVLLRVARCISSVALNGMELSKPLIQKGKATFCITDIAHFLGFLCHSTTVADVPHLIGRVVHAQWYVDDKTTSD